MLRWQGEEVRKIGAILGLTVQPDATIATLPQATLDQLAQECLDINKKGVPVLLRYGHEMNGPWTTYGLKPLDYVQGFQRMSRTIKRFTNLTGKYAE